MSEERKKFREKFRRVVEKLRKTDPRTAEKMIEKREKIITWYQENRREMTLEEFKEILEIST